MYNLYCSGSPLISEDSRIFVQTYGLSVRISSLEMSDSGRYSCTAENHFGRDDISYDLVVKCKQTILSRDIRALFH